MKILKITILATLLLVLVGCSEKIVPCPKQAYPRLQTIDKVPSERFNWTELGVLNFEDTQRLGKQNRALRITSNYYRKTIKNYNREFADEQNKTNIQKDHK